MLAKAKVTVINNPVKLEWNCPVCGEHNVETFQGDPYVALAEDQHDVMCTKCEDFFTLDFYA
jgi:transcription elongation factor Elf1